MGTKEESRTVCVSGCAVRVRRELFIVRLSIMVSTALP